MDENIVVIVHEVHVILLRYGHHVLCYLPRTVLPATVRIIYRQTVPTIMGLRIWKLEPTENIPLQSHRAIRHFSVVGCDSPKVFGLDLARAHGVVYVGKGRCDYKNSKNA
jgi:hypothetical protein